MSNVKLIGHRQAGHADDVKAARSFRCSLSLRRKDVGKTHAHEKALDWVACPPFREAVKQELLSLLESSMTLPNELLMPTLLEDMHACSSAPPGMDAP